MWRTQLLPLGEITYKGQQLKFDKDYLQNLVRSFKDKAFGQVPFQLADGNNKHNNDPERTRGKIVGVEMTNDGLDLILEATRKGDELLRDNPELGVSARIYEDYERSDGKHWKAALQHVLGTLDPHIAGMRTWQEVEVPVALSNELGTVEVLDLSDATFGEREGGDKVAFTLEDKGQLLELLKKARNASDDDLEGLVDELTEDDDDGESDDESELSDEDLDALIAQAEADMVEDEDTDDDEDEEEEDEVAPTDRVPATVSASQRRQALELANANALIVQQGEHLDAVQAGLDEQAFQNERTQFANALGIPPAIVDLARPLLEGSGHVVELSGGDEIDAGQVMRTVLTEIGKQIKLLDLSGVIGNGLEPDEEREEREQEVQETRDFVKAARSAFAL
jgi:hypothetical protein